MLPTLYILSLPPAPGIPKLGSTFSQLGLGLLEASSVLLPRALYFKAWFLSESFPTVDWIIPRTPFSLSPSPLSPLSAESYLLPSDEWEPWCRPCPAGVDQFSSGEGAALLRSEFPQPWVGSGR